MPAAHLPELILVHRLGRLVTGTFGPVFCRFFGVGKLRKELARELPVIVSDSGAYREALHILESHCRLCRGCKLGRE